MSTSQLSTQSAVARRSAEAQVRELVARFAPAHQRLIGTMRRWLRRRLPAAHEVVYEYSGFFVISYSPTERGYEGVLAIRAGASGVKLYFNRGKELPDPEKLLRGTAKQTRSIHMEGASTLARPAVARLIDEAIARNRVPFASTGRGPVVIRSGKKRGQS
jgi:DNA-binding transcriptional MocR family regulator